MSVDNTTQCCPVFEPKSWDDKTFEWTDKIFIKDKVTTFFYMPLNFGKAMVRLDNLVSQSDSEVEEWLCLSEHTSKWNMNLYLAVNKEIQNAENIRISGKYYCKVFEGSFNKTGEWTKEFAEILKSKGINAVKPLIWYTTCPKCAKKYGKNYVAFFGKQ
ncbi:MAG: hypothetical protein KIT33_14995 [Candidatus Kapabacteria bacterium]|nr:hypothetical protein [Ignavibacteriota bacterium]MCW5886276.1 hypothetical protein [Candidatus Kapabacteria bacterium]